MTGPSPFDHRPDPALGRALRAVLSGGHDVEFTSRVMAASRELFAQPSRGGWAEVLAAWARPGLAAAALLLTATVIWLGVATGGTNGNGAPLGDPLSATNAQLAVPALLASPVTPDVDVVLAVALEN
ncbi:MAG: hypothetical protein ACE5PT_07260 [Gemmatimonadales bacterium]